MALILVTTLPPGVAGDAALEFCQAARHAGAEALELRSDLHQSGDVDASRLASILPLLAAERGTPLLPDWLQVARWVDRPLESRQPAGAARVILSHHAPQPMSPSEAVALWAEAKPAPAASLKHVEPLGSPEDGGRLLETQRRLAEAFPGREVTVLATGPLALPFRSLLAERNALDYVSLGAWAAAEGQRPLEDAVREQGRPGKGLPRRGVVGTALAHSRSPRLHRQPFDRIDVPLATDLGPFLAALLPHYDGLAITSPFKKAVAREIGSHEPAVNTLVRRRGASGSSWRGFNTDVAGAHAVLRRLRPESLQVLGDGGATAAVRMACVENSCALTVLRLTALPGAPLSGTALWTWPNRFDPPERLRFRDCRVGVIAYGEPARRIAAIIRERGGTPILLGPAWFAAQARGQCQLWEAAQ